MISQKLPRLLGKTTPESQAAMNELPFDSWSTSPKGKTSPGDVLPPLKRKLFLILPVWDLAVSPACPSPGPAVSWGFPESGQPPRPVGVGGLTHLHGPVTEEQQKGPLGRHEAQQAEPGASWRGGQGRATLLSPPLLHVAGKEPQDSQLGAQQAGHVPQGKRLQVPPVGCVADLAGGRARAVPAVRASVLGT